MVRTSSPPLTAAMARRISPASRGAGLITRPVGDSASRPCRGSPSSCSSVPPYGGRRMSSGCSGIRSAASPGRSTKRAD